VTNGHLWAQFDRRTVVTHRASLAAMFGYAQFFVFCLRCRKHFKARAWSHSREVEIDDKGRPCPMRSGR